MQLRDVFTDWVALPPASEPIDRKTIPAHGGVFAFADEHGAIIQVLSAESIRRSAMFRLEPPKESRTRSRADIRAAARKLWWIPTYSQFETMLTYLTVSRRLWPKDYHKLLAFGPAWFAGVGLHHRLPRWRVDRFAFAQGVQDVGPFDTRRRCAEFVELLEDLFDLCRHYDILQQAPEGEPCAYFEMGKCPAPCDGSISLDEYRRMVAASMRFAVGAPEQRFEQLDSLMRQAADRREFAVAAGLKERIARAGKTLDRARPVVTSPTDFAYLVVQRGRRRSMVKPFFIDRGGIESGPSVAIRKVPDAVTDWMNRVHRGSDGPLEDPVHRSEVIWLVVHFLAKGDNAPGLFLRAGRLPTPDKLAGMIEERFSRPKGAVETHNTS